MVKIGMVSLGCPKNLVDSEVMLGSLASRGCVLTSRADEADVLIVNTCGFIGPARKESIDTILEMSRYKREGSLKKLIVTGCLVQGYAEELRRELPEVDAFLGSADFRSICEAVEGLLPFRVSTPVDLYDERLPRLLSTPPWTAYLKIAEGCDHACSFCQIPRLRGRMRSRPLESIVEEARRLAAMGVRELNLISQDSSEYGRDLYGTPRLTELLAALDEVEGLRWVRVHYLYPAFLDDRFMELMASARKLLRYVDLPLQHADDDLLRSMRRPGSFQDNLELLRRFRRKVPGVTLRSSFIVGYPGESEERFERLLEFLKLAELDRVGFFAYSREDHTPSGALPGQVPERVKRERLKRARKLADEISAARLRARVGEEIEVLVEAEGLGRSQGDALEIDGKVRFTSRRPAAPGEFIRVRVTGSTEHDLIGEALE